MAKLIKVNPEILRVDAFYGGEGQGNLAGVTLLEAPLETSQMQALAKKVGASETAFVVKGIGALSLRWFSPTQEIALCGHGTLASSYVLWDKALFLDNSEISFQTLSGVLTCRKTESGKIEMSFPELRITPDHVAPSTLAALGISRPLFVGVSENYLLIEIESEDLLKNLKPNFEALKKVVQRGFLITTRSQRKPYDFVSRCFFPKEGIPEDPVTGSAHCALGPYWRKKLNKNLLLAYQASECGGELEVGFETKRVLLRGRARYSRT